MTYLVNTLSHPVGKDISKTLNFEEKSYFYIDRQSMDALVTQLGMDEASALYLVERGFWELLIQQYTEQHSEGGCQINVLADTFIAFATGAKPVQVSMQGAAYMTRTEDHRLDFLHLYNNYFRGTRLRELNLILGFRLKHTFLRLKPTDMTVATSSRLEDFSILSLNGYGYQYGVS